MRSGNQFHDNYIFEFILERTAIKSY